MSNLSVQLEKYESIKKKYLEKSIIYFDDPIPFIEGIFHAIVEFRTDYKEYPEFYFQVRTSGDERLIRQLDQSRRTLERFIKDRMDLLRGECDCHQTFSMMITSYFYRKLLIEDIDNELTFYESEQVYFRDILALFAPSA